jgi:hypothetical protein
MYSSGPRFAQIDTFVPLGPQLFRQPKNSKANRYASNSSDPRVTRDHLTVTVSVPTLRSGAELTFTKSCMPLYLLATWIGVMSNYFSLGKGAPMLPRGTTRM